MLVSSRDRVLPGEDADAATVIEDVFRSAAWRCSARSRAAGVERTADGVVVTLADGRTVEGSHALLAVGSVPNTAGLGLEEVGVALTASGHIEVDRVSRTNVRGVYAAGDCTGVLPLASVAAMQGRIAMSHALGDAVAPLDVDGVAANIFTAPEIATVGHRPGRRPTSRRDVESVMLPLARNPRAKMHGHHATASSSSSAARAAARCSAGSSSRPRRPSSSTRSPLAVQNRLRVDQVASTFTVYPSMSGSIAEAATCTDSPSPSTR